MSGRRILHVIHDFLPRHAAGSEIYAFELAREQARSNAVWVLAAEYDPAAAHGSVRWREQDGVPVVEVVNNWEFADFAATYQSPRLNAQIVQVLATLRPDIVHVHNLLNLSFDLPRLARDAGARVVATLHDYTLVCPSGGQRLHQAEAHRCDVIDPDRCARCFAASPFAGQMAAGAVTASPVGRLAGRIASTVRRVLPQSAIRLSRSLPRRAVTSDEIRERLRQAGLAFGQIDLVVAPSAATAAEFAGLGFLSPAVDVSDYGFRLDPAADRRPATDGRLRIGYTGSIVWHKGLHVLLAAVRQLRGRYEVTIAGSLDVAPDYVRSLRRLAAGLPVSFAGPFARGEAPRIYAALDVLAVPSLWLENSPLVIHEAFAYGVAVVGSRLGGIPDLVIDGVNGFTCEAGSPAALAAVLQRFVDDPALAPALAARAPMVRTIADDASAWERRYGSLVGEPAGP